MHAAAKPAADPAALDEGAAHGKVVTLGARPAALEAGRDPTAVSAPTPSAAVVTSAMRAARWLRKNGLSLLLWCLSIGMLLAIWYFGTRYRVDFFIRFTNIPTPAEVLGKVSEVAQSSKYMTNIGISVRRIFAGFGIAILVAVPMGLLIGRYRAARDLLLPAAEVLRPIPATA